MINERFIGDAIRIRRSQLGMSQQELADTLGYKSRSTVAKIEAGEVGLNYRKLAAVAAALGTSIDTLTAGADEVAEADASAKPSKTVAVVLAGGSSSRNAESTPNQFIDVAGKPVIMYCLEAYQKHPSIDAIYVVCLKGWEEVLRTYIKKFNITKFAGLIEGGATGMQSVARAIDVLAEAYPPNTTVLLQESTRPMISASLISKALVNCKEQGSAVAYKSMDEYVQFTLDEGGSMNYLNRDRLYSIESPEAYPLQTILDALDEAYKKSIPLDDTCFAMLVYKLGYQLCCYESGSNNIKIVRQEDLAYFRALLGARV